MVIGCHPKYRIKNNLWRGPEESPGRADCLWDQRMSVICLPFGHVIKIILYRFSDMGENSGTFAGQKCSECITCLFPLYRRYYYYEPVTGKR
jgi:hypothetical protein